MTDRHRTLAVRALANMALSLARSRADAEACGMSSVVDSLSYNIQEIEDTMDVLNEVEVTNG
jgi:hypothetical protein